MVSTLSFMAASRWSAPLSSHSTTSRRPTAALAAWTHPTT